MSVAEIESAIVQLPANEFAELLTWMADYHQRMWDQQIENDAEAGRLDHLLTEVDEEYKAGLARPL
jgi:hypothetical protein